MRDLDVIVPAGGTIDETLTKIVNTNNKAMIKFEGVSILQTTINALRGTGRVNRIAVIGPESMSKTAEGSQADEFILEGLTGPENIFRGLDWLKHAPSPPSKVMIVTADLPFLTAEALNNYLDLCPDGQDFCVPLISQEQFLDTYPRADATFVKLKDGVWTTGCAYLASTQGLETAVHHLEKVFARRKSKLGIARLLGFGFVVKYLMKSLGVPDVERKVSELLDVKAVAIRNSPPQLAYDIDFQDDYAYVLSNLDAHKRAL